MKKIFIACVFLLSACSQQSSISTGNASGSATRSVRLNWAASTGDVSSYVIDQAAGNGAFSTVKTVPAPTTNVTITGPLQGSYL